MTADTNQITKLRILSVAFPPSTMIVVDRPSIQYRCRSPWDLHKGVGKPSQPLIWKRMDSLTSDLNLCNRKRMLANDID